MHLVLDVQVLSIFVAFVCNAAEDKEKTFFDDVNMPAANKAEKKGKAAKKKKRTQGVLSKCTLCLMYKS